MNNIQLHNVVPDIFSSREDLHSDIWCRDFGFERGKSYLIKAASGTGKSSLCSYLYGQRGDYRGDILFDGENVAAFNTNRWCDIRQHHISVLFQDLKLFGELTSLENIEIKNNITHHKGLKEIELLFEEFGIGDKIHSRIDRMSFGQQQRVAFIRALCQPYDYILLDEPVSHLDDANGDIMRDILLRETLAKGAALITTSIGKHMNIDYDVCLNL